MGGAKNLKKNKGSELRKNCIRFFTGITIDSDMNTQAYSIKLS